MNLFLKKYLRGQAQVLRYADLRPALSPSRCLPPEILASLRLGAFALSPS